MIRELTDPFIEENPLPDRVWRRVRRLMGKGKGLILRLGTKASRSGAIHAPVIGYTEGAEGRKLEKRALITYVAWPFRANPEELELASHSNGPQALEIAGAFNRLGYIVDIVDWLDTTFVPTVRYDAFFGINDNFGRLLPYMDEKTIRIYYGTGSYWAFEIVAERSRIENLRQRRGVELVLPIRLGANDFVQRADAVIVLGNRFVLDTYRPHNTKLFAIDNSALHTTEPDLEHKDFSSARRNFLWFGSTGLLHKGLDLVLEAFVGLANTHLWVCGPLQSPDEQEFVRVYRHELFHSPNVHPIGWTSIYSEQFIQLAERCGFVVLASCAEGMPGGTLDCMARGLIPLISREAGIDTDRIGITFHENSINTIREVIAQMAAVSPESCRRMAQTAYRQATTRYALETFSRRIEQILEAILGENQEGRIRSIKNQGGL